MLHNRFYISFVQLISCWSPGSQMVAQQRVRAAVVEPHARLHIIRLANIVCVLEAVQTFLAEGVVPAHNVAARRRDKRLDWIGGDGTGQNVRLNLDLYKVNVWLPLSHLAAMRQKCCNRGIVISHAVFNRVSIANAVVCRQIGEKTVESGLAKGVRSAHNVAARCGDEFFYGVGCTAGTPDFKVFFCNPFRGIQACFSWEELPTG